MNYLSVGAENLNDDKTPSSGGFHPAELYRRQRAELVRRLGYVELGGQRYPRLSYDECLTLIMYWQKVGSAMAKKVVEAKPFSGGHVWAEKILHETKQFSQYMSVWTTTWLVQGTIAKDPTARLPAEASRQLFQGPMSYASGIIQFALGLEALVWGNFNIELPTIWGGIKAAVKASGKTITKPFVLAMDAASTSWTITKVALYATVAAAGLWAVSMIAKAGRDNVKGTK